MTMTRASRRTVSVRCIGQQCSPMPEFCRDRSQELASAESMPRYHFDFVDTKSVAMKAGSNGLKLRRRKWLQTEIAARSCENGRHRSLRCSSASFRRTVTLRSSISPNHEPPAGRPYDSLQCHLDNDRLAITDEGATMSQVMSGRKSGVMFQTKRPTNAAPNQITVFKDVFIIIAPREAHVIHFQWPCLKGR
jgi:hypothetical protein